MGVCGKNVCVCMVGKRCMSVECVGMCVWGERETVCVCGREMTYICRMCVCMCVCVLREKMCVCVQWGNMCVHV